MTYVDTQAEQLRRELATLTLELTPTDEMQAPLLALEMIDVALDEGEAEHA